MARADKGTRLLGDYEVNDGVALPQTFEGTPSDPTPHLNGLPIELVTAYRWNEATGWSQSVRSRADIEVAAPRDVPDTGSGEVVHENLGYSAVEESVCGRINEIIDGKEECLRELEQDPHFERTDPDMGLPETLETDVIHRCAR